MDRLAIIDHGRIISQGTPTGLKATSRADTCCVCASSVTEELLAELKALAGVTEVRSPDRGSVDVYADRGGPLIGPIVNAAQAAGFELHDVHIAEPSLETLFLHHTGRSLRD